ncbi:tryptophan transporter [Sporolactobacillus sp. THM7-7]|nr:tryptophan transporter [Sporolactobacillus sp. THM7-7]
MKLQNLVIVALLLAIGTVVHAVFPGLVFGMKSDLSLVMLFLALYFFADVKSFLIIGLADGILAGLTSSIGGGFIPNVFDKLVTSTVVFFLFALVARYLSNKVKYIAGVVLAGLATVLSGTLFLSFLILFTPFEPGVFLGMFATVVLPAAAVNAVLMAVLYPIIVKIAERSGVLKTTGKSV